MLLTTPLQLIHSRFEKIVGKSKVSGYRFAILKKAIIAIANPSGKTKIDLLDGLCRVLEEAVMKKNNLEYFGELEGLIEYNNWWLALGKKL